MTNESEKIRWKDLKQLNNEEIDGKAKEILSKLHLDEKLNFMAGDWRMLSIKGLRMAIKYNWKPIPAGFNKRLGIDGIKFTDGPRGIVMGNSTCFPVSIARGASWDIELEEKIGNAIGIEGRAQGANFFGGVCINLLRHPAWGRAQETYGEDPLLLGKMGVALTKGVQNHLMACAKHYACNSIENARFKVDVKINERTLREVYLPHFKMCVDAGVASIMNAYNKVNGKYCGHNPHLLTNILKNDWSFDGFVITDFMFGIRDGEKAVNAGVDIEMPFKWRMKPKKLRKLLESKQISIEQINDSVLRILRQLILLNNRLDENLDYSKDKVASDEHINLALESARKSIVLLKNKNNLLPLKKEKIKNIAIIGKLANIPNIGDKGSSCVYPPYIVTPLEGLKKIADNEIEIEFEDGSDLEQAKMVSENADVVIIVVGYTHKDEGEYIVSKGGDRDSLRLSDEDEKLIKSISSVNNNSIVLIESGSAVIVEEWKDLAAAILMVWYPGMEGGTAIAEILFGEVNPQGKLPFIVPKKQEELPYFDKNAKEIDYEYYHGYKLLDKQEIEPAYHFGYGLSYNTYSYSNLRINEGTLGNKVLRFSVDIQNNGQYRGDEIAQAYIGYQGSAFDRPVKELKSFTNVALNPNEKKTIEMSIDKEDLNVYNSEKAEWQLEDIDYILYVGPSANPKHLLKTEFTLKK